jgi:hypothetical protein
MAFLKALKRAEPGIDSALFKLSSSFRYDFDDSP